MIKRLDKKKISILVLAALIFMGIGVSIGAGSNSSTSTVGDGHDHQDGHDLVYDEIEQVWTCAMHPQIKLPKPGKCPICGMTLIPVETGNTSDVEGPKLELSSYAQKLAKVQTTRVVKGNVSGTRDLNGAIVWNESLLKTEPAWFSGRIENLKVSYVGQYVRKGQVIAEIYSPELYAAAEEWKQAKSGTSEALKKSVYKKLELLGLSESDITSLETTSSEKIKQKASHSGVVVHLGVEEGQYIKTGTPLVKLGSTSNLWIELDVFEEDLPAIKLKQTIDITTESLKNTMFKAKVEFIHPILDKKTRTVKVRLSIENPKNLLKPGMLVRGIVNIDADDDGLYIPETSPLITGKQAIVYLEAQSGVYVGRAVELGELKNGFYEVLSGLSGGEIVVKRGAFKIDAAMQIQALPSMMYPQGGVVTKTHDHGGAKMKKGTEMDDEPETKADHSKMNMKTKGLNEESKKWLNEFYSEYLKMQDYLADEKNVNGAKSLKKLAMKLHTTPDVLNDGTAHKNAAKFESIANSGDVDKIRNTLIQISKDLKGWIKNNNFKPKQGAAIYFCPMADNNNGAEWIQKSGDVKNPYLGKDMGSCGEQKEVISLGGK